MSGVGTTGSGAGAGGTTGAGGGGGGTYLGVVGGAGGAGGTACPIALHVRPASAATATHVSNIFRWFLFFIDRS
jgi:hypothetical protein